MQVQVERIAPCTAKVTFTVPAAEVDETVRHGLEEAGRHVRMKGFRPGKVPAAVVERAHGERVRHEAIEHFLRQAYDQAVGENDLRVVGHQRVDLGQVRIERGQDLSHSFEVSLRPEIELGSYAGTKVESELEPVLDQEVEAALADLRRQQAHPEAAGEAGLPEDGMALAKVEWLAGEEVVLVRDGLRLSPPTPTPGVEPEAFRQALHGAKDGEVVDLPMTFPGDFERAELQNQAGTSRVTVSQAFRMVPPGDDELRRILGAEPDADLAAVVRGKIEEMKREQEDRRLETVLLEKLIAEHPMELPETLLAEQTKARLIQMRRELESQGMPEETIAQEEKAREAEMRAAAAKGLSALFLVQTIAEKEGLLVTQEDLRHELESIAERNKATLEEVLDYYRKQNLVDQMAIEILERKVRKFLRESAEVTQPV